MHKRRFKKNKLSHWFSEVKFSSRAKFLGGNLKNKYCQGTQNRGRIFPYTSFRGKEATSSNTHMAAVKVVSEDLMVPFEALDNPIESFSKGSSINRFSFSISLCNSKIIQIQPSVVTVLDRKSTRLNSSH